MNKMTQFTITMDEEKVLFLVETIAVGYVQLTTEKAASSNGMPELSSVLLREGIQNALEESLRTLLRIPLGDPDFRHLFYKHFSTHEHPFIKEVAWPWMEENLEWTD